MRRTFQCVCLLCFGRFSGVLPVLMSLFEISIGCIRTRNTTLSLKCRLACNLLLRVLRKVCRWATRFLCGADRIFISRFAGIRLAAAQPICDGNVNGNHFQMKSETAYFPPTFQTYCGPGENRTPVQTRERDAFYTLSTFAIVCHRQGTGNQPMTYPLKTSFVPQGRYKLFPICCTTCSICFGTTAIGWCLVPTPCVGIKPIYYTSIRQRERNSVRQINFRSSGL